MLAGIVTAVFYAQPGTNSVGNLLVKVSVPPSQTDYHLNNNSTLSSAGGRCMSSTPIHPPEPAPRHSVWKEGTKRHLTDSTIIVSRMRPAQRPPCGTAGIALSVPRNPVMPFERVCGFVWAAKGVGWPSSTVLSVKEMAQTQTEFCRRPLPGGLVQTSRVSARQMHWACWCISTVLSSLMLMARRNLGLTVCDHIRRVLRSSTYKAA